MPILERISGPADVKALSPDEKKALAGEIRQKVIAVTAANGGHIGPNLGVVELTIALHSVFSTPEDRLVFDVAHQGYVHKLLTGRNDERFENIRKSGGYSGFLARNESEHDCYGAGHAGTALSAALGMAAARDRLGGQEHVVAILGDAAFTCGITMEALNNLTSHTKRLILVLNDNEWSIDKNVGAIARYLNQLITNPVYNRIDADLKALVNRLPWGSESIMRFGSKWKKETKDFFVSSSLFESYGLRYVGPVEGHDIESLIRFFEFAKQNDGPIVLHLLTEKGRGYPVALQDPEKFHGTGSFDIETGQGRAKPQSPLPPKYQDVFGQTVLEMARKDRSVAGITAAMPSGTGMDHLRDNLPGQYYDVGIAEEHAVLFAAGMATRGMKPVVAIYSTFLQRAVDPLIHDIGLQDLPVIFGLDRAGLSPNDGPTHHGLFDLGFLRGIPNTIIAQPADEDQLVSLLHSAREWPHPTFIRYPRGTGTGVPIRETPEAITPGSARILREGRDLALWALGPWVQDALEIAEALERDHALRATVVDARFVKPLDRKLLAAQAGRCELIVTLEDHVANGGFGSAVVEALAEQPHPVRTLRIGWPDRFIDHGDSVASLRQANGLSREAILERILHRFRGQEIADSTAAIDSATS